MAKEKNLQDRVGQLDALGEVLVRVELEGHVLALALAVGARADGNLS